MAKMRALITGMTGMVGSHMADFLLEHTDWDLYGLCLWNSDFSNIEHLMPRINKGDRIFLLNGDLRDYVSLVDVVKRSRPDYIFHLAAQSFPKSSFTAPLDTLETNLLGTYRLLEIVKEFGELVHLDPVIHVCASSEVFGMVSRDKIPIHEETAFHPASPYAISKIGADLIGRFYAEAYGLKTVMTRMFTHTGPRRGDVFAESSFAKQIAMIEAGFIPPVVKAGNLGSLRTWSDVRDAVRAYYLLVTVNPIPGEYYNIGGTYTCTVGEMLDFLLSLSTVRGIKVEIDPERLRPIDADLQIPDIRKFQKHTGWAPQIPFEKTMGDLLDYWRAKVKLGKQYLTR